MRAGPGGLDTFFEVSRRRGPSVAVNPVEDEQDYAGDDPDEAEEGVGADELNHTDEGSDGGDELQQTPLRGGPRSGFEAIHVPEAAGL